MSHGAHPTAVMNRRKAEQFRKARNNYWRRGYEIGHKCGAEMLVLMRRNGKIYRFTNSDSLLRLSQAEIVSKKYFQSTLHSRADRLRRLI
jgi:hypothetical protein